jgi:hypothetical protein
VPPLRAFAEFRVLPDPLDIRFERLDEAFDGGLERYIDEINAIDARERVGDRSVFHAPTDNRREAFVEPRCKRNLPQGDLGRNRIRAEHEHNRVRPRDQGLDPLPPDLQICDIAAVNRGLKPLILQSLLQAIDECRVPARVGDEDTRFWRNVVVCGLHRVSHEIYSGQGCRKRGALNDAR